MARLPRELISTLAWPGVWPVLGISPISGQMRWSHSTSSASPRSKIGRTLSANTGSISARSVCRLQCSYSTTAEEIARVRESGQPLAVDQPGVPAHVVDVQVRAQHGIDRLGRKTGRRQIVKEAALPIIPSRYTALLFVIAETGVDDDPPPRRFDDKGVDAHLEAANLVGEVRHEPGNRQHRRARGLRQDESAAASGLALHDLAHADVAELPLHRSGSMCNVQHSGHARSERELREGSKKAMIGHAVP